jgi:hypothetical protein
MDTDDGRQKVVVVLRVRRSEVLHFGEAYFEGINAQRLLHRADERAMELSHIRHEWFEGGLRSWAWGWALEVLDGATET